MKLAYLTKYSESELKLASGIGYDALEIHITSLPIDVLSTADDELKKGLKEVKETFNQNNLSISALSLYTTNIDEKDKRVNLYKKCIEASKLLGVDVITTLTGGLTDKSLAENVEIWAEAFKEIAKIAEDNEIKIAFENWPALSSGPPVTTKNFGFHPLAWEQMFQAVPSPALGLEFDPSHLVWQGIDYIDATITFADRIYHVHAKDTEIFEDRYAQKGFFGKGWWRYRIPGYGCIDWHTFLSVLRENGYDGGISIEHEDGVLKGEIGLKLGYNYLRPLVV